MDLPSIHEHQELGLDSSIEVSPYTRSSVTVHSNVVPVAESGSEVFVILLNFGTHRVPRSSEVEECVSRLVLVQVVHNIVQAFRGNVVLTSESLDRSASHSKHRQGL